MKTELLYEKSQIFVERSKSKEQDPQEKALIPIKEIKDK